MSDIPAGLAKEFPELKNELYKQYANSTHFRTLVDEYRELSAEEEATEEASRQEGSVEGAKNASRLSALRDEIYSLIKGAE